MQNQRVNGDFSRCSPADLWLDVLRCLLVLSFLAVALEDT